MRRVVSIKASYEPGTFNERSYLPEKEIKAAVELSANLFLVAVSGEDYLVLFDSQKRESTPIPTFLGEKIYLAMHKCP